MLALLGVICLFAMLALIVAVSQAARLSRASGQGAGWREWLFGWWRFETWRAKAGPDGAAAATIYQRATVAFIVFVILGLILSGWAVNTPASPASAAAAPRLINDPRIIPAQFAMIEQSSVSETRAG
jgi:hypothetical protein